MSRTDSTQKEFNIPFTGISAEDEILPLGTNKKKHGAPGKFSIIILLTLYALWTLLSLQLDKSIYFSFKVV